MSSLFRPYTAHRSQVKSLSRAREPRDRYSALVGKIFPVKLYALNLVQGIRSEVIFAARGATDDGNIFDH